jgi:filamentous hemagglutinin family protein
MSIKGNACWDWFLGIAISGAFSVWANCALAQITPDSTLPSNSRVIPSGNINLIEGGTQSGSNLFHSFQQFSVPTGSTAHFNNALDIQNIISRVTGGAISNIDGLIRAEGKANLFLINPSGIVFGQNARLDVGGSFFASTASVIKFADGFEFSATIPENTPLLTISVPIGLQFGVNPQRILVQGNGQGLRTIDAPIIDTQNALRVQPNQTLALVGGNLALEGATLKTAGGRIELGSVGDNSLVSLTPNNGFSLNYSGVQNFKDIQLSQQAAVDASGLGSGDVQVVGRNIKLTDGSQIEASTLGSNPGGTLVVNAQDSVQLIGTSANSNSLSGLSARVFPGATGAAGDVTINTRQLLIQDGARISTTTFGAGNGGKLTVNADSVQVSGTSAEGEESGLFAQTEPREIPSPIPIRQRVTSLTGAAGDVTINTRQLLVENGGQIQAATFGAGKGGDLTVNADFVQLTGIASNGRRLGSGLVTSTAEGTTGAAGNVTINTNQLLVEDGGRVVVRSRGTGNAGNLTVNAGSIRLDNNATLIADTTSTSTNSNQATININSRDLILRRGSNITANATGSDVIGGNINIDTSILAAVENSFISTDSRDFRGGKVKINTSGIVRSLDSSITARGVSQEFSGTVQINTPDVDASRGLLKLPRTVVDTTTLIASSCNVSNKNGSEFIITGRGGFPPSPDDFLSSDVLWSDTRLPTTTAEEYRSEKPAKPAKLKTVEIIPATGWVIDDKGEVTLISSALNATSSVSPPSCAKERRPDD